MLTLMTPPALLPVDLVLAKTFLRVDHVDEDVLIESFIGSAVTRIETALSRVMMTRTYRLTAPADLGPLIPIKPVPVAGILDMRVTNGQGGEVVIPPADYTLDLRREPAELRLKSGQFSDYLAGACDVQVTFTAGYGAEPGDVPLPIRQAVLLLTAQSYEHRDQPDHPALPMMAEALLMPYRTYRLSGGRL
ncbi:head-tail connector protein [Robiginitomaculum antarcticum]|uniref:head-tail connector protein n=1 Tax=Robiginitomaculum antarcticum TaxID=437507 RepID=UPI0003A3D697|nr:phage head-tail connector protein [Robiginitomaculum antarcticum]